MKLIKAPTAPDMDDFIGGKSAKKPEEKAGATFTLKFSGEEWDEVNSAYESSPQKSKGDYLKNAASQLVNPLWLPSHVYLLVLIRWQKSNM